MIHNYKCKGRKLPKNSYVIGKKQKSYHKILVLIMELQHNVRPAHGILCGDKKTLVANFWNE